MVRIVSLLPSATEILCALGLESSIVGISHECDFPADIRKKRVVIHSRIPKDAGPAEIDRQVREYVQRGESVYAVDGIALQELAPNLIVTQDLCHVCAASPDDLATVLAGFRKRPEVLCLNPQDLGDVWRDILWVGQRTGRTARAEAAVQEIGSRLGKLELAIDNSVSYLSRRPRVAFLEWLQPLYVGGHWVPEMIESAGGKNVFGAARTPSFRIELRDVVEAAPEFLFIAPCGYNAEQARDEYRAMSLPEEWGSIPAVRDGRVYALEANIYFSRPGPRLFTGIEILAKLLHPAIQVSREAATAILPIAHESRLSKTAFV